MQDINLPKDAQTKTEKWSEYVRKKESEKLKQPSILRKIEKIVEDCETDLNKLWILDMFANNISKNNVLEAAELIFEEDMDIMVDNVEAGLKVSEITDMTAEIKENLQVGEAIRANIAKKELARMKDKVRSLANDSSKPVKEGIHLLSLYVRDDFDHFQTQISKKGFERTWKIFSDQEEVDSDKLVETGLVYKTHHEEDNRDFWNYIVPNYSLELLENLVEGTSKIRNPCSQPSENEIKNKIEEERVKEFVRWMHGTNKYIEASKEENQVQKELEEKEISLTLDEFKETRDELVKNNILILKYSPVRSSSSSENGKPATWKYELTRPAINSVPILRWRPEEFYPVRES